MKKTKILILSINHVWCDTRLYYKIARSLLKRNTEIKMVNNCVKSHNLTSTISDSCSHQLAIRRTKLAILFNFIYFSLKYKPDIIICIEPLSLLSGYILKKLLKCRFIYDNHEFYSEAFQDKMIEYSVNKNLAFILSKIYWQFEKFFASKTDAIITVNEHLVKKLETANKNIYLCANYLNSDMFFTNNIAESTSETKCYDLVYTGSIAFERGLKIYLETAKMFKQEDKKITILIIGRFKNASTEAYFFNYIKQYKLENHVIYKPFMLNENVLKEIRKCKIGIFMGNAVQCPKYHKTIHMKIYEYFSQSTPVIINYLDMLVEFVHKSEAGWIINYSSKELFNLTVSIVEEQMLLTQKGRAGYQYALSNCVWENQEQQLYQAILDER